VVTGVSLGCSRALRAFALTLGLVALTLQGLAPLCLNMMGGPSGSAGGYSIVLCTIHGYQTIQIDADGKPAPNAPVPDQQNSTCPICTGFHQANAFTAPALVLLVVPTDFRRAPPAIMSLPVRPLKSHFSYVSRAPPASASFG
jgi:hypothetical protein